jgi:hypothetical protein
VTLALLIPGVGMGGGTAAAAVTFIPPIGRKIGIERPDGPDANMPTGITGVSA